MSNVADMTIFFSIFRNLPRAIMISMTVVIVTYLIANVAYLGVLSPAEMLLSPAVAVVYKFKYIYIKVLKKC